MIDNFIAINPRRKGCKRVNGTNMLDRLGTVCWNICQSLNNKFETNWLERLPIWWREINNLDLVVWCWIFEVMGEAIGFWASLIFCWWKREAFFSPFNGLHYCDAVSCIEFTFYLECMVFCIWTYFKISIGTKAEVEIFLARGCKGVRAIDVFLKLRVSDILCEKRQYISLTATWSILAPSPFFTAITFDSICSIRFDTSVLSEAALSIRDATLASSFIGLPMNPSRLVLVCCYWPKTSEFADNEACPVNWAKRSSWIE